MKSLYLSILSSLFLLTSVVDTEAAEPARGERRGGGGWRHGGGGHGGGGHCKRWGEGGKCSDKAAQATLTAFFESNSIAHVTKLEVDKYQPIKGVVAGQPEPIQSRRERPIFVEPGESIPYSIKLYDVPGGTIGRFEEGVCGPVKADFKGGRIQMTFKKTAAPAAAPGGAHGGAQVRLYSCELTYPQ